MRQRALLRSSSWVCLLAAALWLGLAQAQTVGLSGVLGGKALLVVDGSAPRAVAPGETHLGVKVLSVTGDQALVQVHGQLQTLQLGQAPAVVRATAAGADGHKIVLSADEGGHFFAQGSINSRAQRFMVDTGASAVSLSAEQAQSIGLDYRSATPVTLSTANGLVRGWLVRLATVRIGDVQVHDVEGVVTPQPMAYVLLGNSFLSRFQMRRENDLMTLERRY